MTDIVERLRAENAKLQMAQPPYSRRELEAEIERLRMENEVLIATLKEPDQVGYWQRKHELTAAEIKRLRQSINVLIEVYAPPERKSVLRQEHLGEPG
jgi:hypothetical protein